MLQRHDETHSWIVFFITQHGAVFFHRLDSCYVLSVTVVCVCIWHSEYHLTEHYVRWPAAVTGAFIQSYQSAFPMLGDIDD